MVSPGQKRLGASGIVLLDLLVYISLLAIVLVLAGVVFDRGMRESTAIQRNVADIERTLKAGERWRADMRAATAPVRLEKIDGHDVLIIPHGNEQLLYRLGEKDIRRGNEVALAGVKTARMIEERRGQVVAWRWEIELEQRRQEGKLRPLFTFLAAPGRSGS
jgi:hypothetical protein